MMDSGHVRNMQSTLTNKYEKKCISLAFIIRIYHVARSSDVKFDKVILRHDVPEMHSCSGMCVMDRNNVLPCVSFSWLRHCATSQKAAASIHDGSNGIFH